MKRAATAIGEGSMAVRLVFDRLEATGLGAADPLRPDSGPGNSGISPSNSEPTRLANHRSECARIDEAGKITDRTVRHLAIDTRRPYEGFRADYEKAVPPFDRLQAVGVVQSGGDW